GLRLVDEGTGGTLAYIPTAAAVDAVVERLAARADLLLFDGTFWSDGELRTAGVDAGTAREMGHLPTGGAGGSVGALPRLGARSCSCGWRTASATSRRSPSRTPPSCPTVPSPTCGAGGSSGSSITTGGRTARAGSRPGCASPRPWGSSGTRCWPPAGCCRGYG